MEQSNKTRKSTSTVTSPWKTEHRVRHRLILVRENKKKKGKNNSLSFLSAETPGGHFVTRWWGTMFLLFSVTYEKRKGPVLCFVCFFISPPLTRGEKSGVRYSIQISARPPDHTPSHHASFHGREEKSRPGEPIRLHLQQLP